MYKLLFWYVILWNQHYIKYITKYQLCLKTRVGTYVLLFISYD